MVVVTETAFRKIQERFPKTKGKPWLAGCGLFEVDFSESELGMVNMQDHHLWLAAYYLFYEGGLDSWDRAVLKALDMSVEELEAHALLRELGELKH